MQMKFFWTDLQDLFFAKSYYRYSTTFNIPAACKVRTCGTALSLGDVF